MKKTILSIAALLVATVASAQFYVSASGGYAFPSAGMQLGTEVSADGTEKNVYGSYGEGMNAQLRAGYFFNDTFGVQLGFGYLHGADQTLGKQSSDGSPGGTDSETIAHARAYGLETSLIYNFNENIYGRFGALIKVGGRTEAITTSKTNISGTPGPGGAPLPADTYLEVNAKADFTGRLPLGFIGAIGYKYPVADNLFIFGELEYMGISVTRDKSTIKEFSGEVVTPDGNRTSIYSLDNLPPGTEKETTYVDELKPGDTGKQLSEKAPYSSFGINVGITYSFGNGSAKKATPAE